MSRLQWDQSSEKVYELGVDRGVVFPPVGEGFVWNGLVSVNETPDGGEFSAYYMDGDPYYIQAQPDNFAATIEAYTYPQGLEPFIGETTGAGGITYTGQTKGSFGLSYRTLIGIGDSGLMEYKIHLVYNAKLSSSEKKNVIFGAGAGVAGVGRIGPSVANSSGVIIAHLSSCKRRSSRSSIVSLSSSFFSLSVSISSSLSSQSPLRQRFSSLSSWLLLSCD